MTNNDKEMRSNNIQQITTINNNNNNKQQTGTYVYTCTCTVMYITIK